MARIDTTAARQAGRTSMLHFFWHYLVAALLIGAGLALRPDTLANWAIAMGVLLLARVASVIVFGTRWWVTGEQVLQSEGVLSRRTHEVPISSVRNVEVHQGFLGRFLDIGSIRVSSGDGDVVLSGVKAPNQVAEKIRTPRAE